MKIGRELLGKRQEIRRRQGKRITGGLNTFRVYIDMCGNVIMKSLFCVINNANKTLTAVF